MQCRRSSTKKSRAHSKNLEVIGLGDADVDIYLDVERLPRWDEKIRADKLDLYPGGMVANFLVVLRSLGTTCGFHGPVGHYEFGQIALANLVASNVDTRGVIMRKKARTYFCVVLLDGSGEKALVIAPTGCVYPEPDELSEAYIAEATHLHTTAGNPDTLSEVVSLARQHNLTISIDVEPASSTHFEQLRLLLPSIDITFAKEEALFALAEVDDLEKAMAHLLKRGLSTVCVTMGARGAIVANHSQTVSVPAFSVPVVDSTGAGDAFAAGFVHAYLQKWPLADSARFASAVAAIIVGHRAETPQRRRARKFAPFLSVTAQCLQNCSQVIRYRVPRRNGETSLFQPSTLESHSHSWCRFPLWQQPDDRGYATSLHYSSGRHGSRCRAYWRRYIGL